MTMKRVLSVVLSALVLMTSMLTVAATQSPVISVSTDSTGYVVTVKATVPTSVTGTMTAQLMHKDSNDVYTLHGIASENTPALVGGKNVYTFVFNMKSDAPTDPYTVRVGNNVEATPYTFNFINPAHIDQKIAFYNGLNALSELEVDGSHPIRDYITNAANSKFIPTDATADYNAYKALTKTRVIELVDARIDSVDLSVSTEGDTNTKLANISAKDVLLTNLLNAVMKIAKLDESSETEWVNTIVPEAVASYGFDTKYFNTEADRTAVLTYGNVYDYFDDETVSIDTVSEFDTSHYSDAFDRATLMAIESLWSPGALGKAFMYYKGESSIAPSDMTNINALIAAGTDINLWTALQNETNTDCATLVANAVRIAGELNGSGGGGGGGGAGGSEPIDKPEAPTTGTGIVSGNNGTTTFSDLAQAEWAREAVEALASMGVVSGKEPGAFYPNDNVKREEGAKIIAGAFEIIEDGATCDFTDVAADRWSYVYIASAVRLGIIEGDGSTFRPESTMTREEMATILYRVYKALGIEITGTPMSFSDDSQISSWAKEAVSVLSGAGAINGMGDGTFNPKAPVTRAQLAKVTYEIMKLVGGVQ